MRDIPKYTSQLSRLIIVIPVNLNDQKYIGMLTIKNTDYLNNYS